MESFYKVVALAAIIGYAYCTIDGLTYRDETKLKSSKPKNDVCNPLYWYPKHIPDECYHNDSLPPRPPPQPIPIPVPVQLPPVGVFQPYPPLPPVGVFQPYPPLPPAQIPQLSLPYLPPGPPDPCVCPSCPPPPVPLIPLPSPPPLYCGCPMCPVMPMPVPVVPVPQIPYGVPIAPTYPMIPVPGLPYNTYNPYSSYYASQNPRPMAGMVPGLPGIVSDDGGINVMPFSDAYSNILEKHKNEEFRKKYKKLIKRIDGKYKSRSRRF